MISDFLHSPDNFQEVIDFNKLQKLPSESPIYEFYIARLWHKKVFIKRLKQEYQDNPFYVSALKKEFEIGVSLNHPSIPVYRDYKKGIIVIDYIEGETLDNLIKTNRLFNNPNDIKKIISQLIDVTDYLHQNNITHCDIKSDNIIISKATGNLILIDFDKCHTDAFDNTRANPKNFGIGKNVNATSDLDFFQISLIIKEILPFIPLSDRKRFIIFISALQKNKVDLEELRKILKQRFFPNKVFRNSLGLVILFLIALLTGFVIFKLSIKEKFSTPIKVENESKPTMEQEVRDSVKSTPLNIEKVTYLDSKSKEEALLVEKNETTIDSADGYSPKSTDENNIGLKNQIRDETIVENPDSLDLDIPPSQSKRTKSVETLINSRMNDLLKPYAEYLKKYEKAVGNPNISYEKMTSIAQGSTDILVKTMENACETLYKEFPEIDKGEIQKIVWLSPPYLNLVNWNIEISERYSKRVMKQFNQ